MDVAGASRQAHHAQIGDLCHIAKGRWHPGVSAAPPGQCYTRPAMSEPPRLDYATPDPTPPVKPASVAVGVAGTLAYGVLFVPALLFWIGIVARQVPSGNADPFCFGAATLLLGWRFAAAVRHLIRSLGRRRTHP